MICPDRCTMELIGTYQGIKINQVYRCRHCTVTSYRSVEMDKEQLIAEMAVENAELREQVRAKDAELERVRIALKFYADGEHLLGDLRDDWDWCSGEPMNLLWSPTEDAWGVEDGSVAKAALASPAGEPVSAELAARMIAAEDGIQQLGNDVAEADKWLDEQIQIYEQAQPAPAAEPAELVPLKLSNDVREYLQEGINNATQGEDDDYHFAHELSRLLGPIYTAPVAQSQEPSHD